MPRKNHSRSKYQPNTNNNQILASKPLTPAYPEQEQESKEKKDEQKPATKTVMMLDI